MFDADVFVSGGGPAGLAAAIAARSAGFRVILADADRPPIDKACGEGLMPEALVAASRIGVHIPLTLGIPFQGVRFVAPLHSVAAEFPEGTGLGIRRTVLQPLLVKYAQEAGVEVSWGFPVTAISGHTVHLGKSSLSARWIVGADGAQSKVRRWAGLDSFRRDSRRFGFRRHYRATPPSHYVEIHWGDGCQFYLTPVAPDATCVALLSRDPHAKIEDALRQFPGLQARLAACEPVGTPRGGLAASRQLLRVSNGNVALIGDASGSVDPIAGEGLSLAFLQAAVLARALPSGDLSTYERAHRNLARYRLLMADLMLALDRWTALRTHALSAFEVRPRLFADFVAMHVRRIGFRRAAAAAALLAWHAATG